MEQIPSSFRTMAENPRYFNARRFTNYFHFIKKGTFSHQIKAIMGEKCSFICS